MGWCLRCRERGVLAAAALLLAGLALASEAAAGSIVFSSNRCPHNPDYGCAQSIWTVGDDGTGMRRVTLGLDAPSDRSNDFAPSWSPDGSRIVYVRQRYPDRNQLWTVRPDGTDMRPLGPDLPDAQLRYADHPEWSPDGRWIVFTGTPADPPPGPGWSAAADLYLIAADGSELRRVTSDPGLERLPTFTPDGRRIVFQRSATRPGGGEAEGLMAVDLDGSNRTPLMVGELPGTPTFNGVSVAGDLSVGHSPDGRWIGFSSFGRIFLMPASGGAPREQVDTGTSNGNTEVQWAWEPRPTFIFSVPRESKPLFAVDLFGGAPPRPLGPPLEPRATGDEGPDWLPSAPAAVEPDSSGAAVALSATRRGSVRPRDLSFLAVDPSGVSRVEAAVASRVRRRGRRLCRFLAGARRLGKARPCARPRYRTVRSVAHWRRLLGRVPAARYRLSVRAVDAGGRTGPPQSLTVRLRR